MRDAAEAVRIVDEPALLGAFDRIGLSGPGAVAVAVSGGGDSLALLLLAREYLASHPLNRKLVAITVDHGLRPEAAAEARAVAGLCGTLGIPHRTMCWDAAKPAAGLQQAAREARYALLAEAAEEAGAGVILTGHTLNDQLETFAMRKRRGDGRGLAGIAPATLYDGRFWIARPLLGIRRDDLRSFLRARGVAWHDDPSNQDPKYERVRVRSLLAGQPFHAGAINEIGRAAEERVRLGAGAAALIRQYARRVSPGLYRLDRAFARAGERAAAIYSLRILLAVAGGRPQLPETARTAALLEHLSRLAGRATLSRSVLEAREDGLYLRRELRGLPPACAARQGEIWDGRYRIEAGAAKGTAIAPFGKDGAEQWISRGDAASTALSCAALAAEPALWRGSECLGPALAKPVAGPWARFLPSFDLAPAAAVTELIGGAPLPASPAASEPAR
jgi:tRNA(Ile)-lysidine synthase